MSDPPKCRGPQRYYPSPTKAHHLNPQETEDASVSCTQLTLQILKKFLITSIQQNIIWKTSRGEESPPAECEWGRIALPVETYCNFSWKHFVENQSYIVAPKYETTGPANHTKQLCPWRKGHWLQSCFFLLLKKCQTTFYAVLMTGSCLLYHQAAITSGQGNCHYLESVYLSDLQER